MAALLAALIVGCVEEVADQADGDGAVGGAQKNVIIGEQDWLPIYEYNWFGRGREGGAIGSVPYEKSIAAQYGTAVVVKGGPSAFFIDGEHVMSCLHGNQSSPVKIEAGRFSEPELSAVPIEAELYALRRQRELGLANPIPFEDARFIDGCERVKRWVTPRRDVTVWRCPKVSIGQDEVYPGDIWGHLKVARDPYPMPQDTPLFALTDNREFADSRFETLLSPHGRVRERDSCYPTAQWDYCFATDLDLGPGSSGGAILRWSDRAVVGVVNSHIYHPRRTEDDWRLPRPYGWTWDWDFPYALAPTLWLGKNYGAYVPPYDEIPKMQVTVAERLSSSSQWTQWAGDHGGNLMQRACPEDYAAVGVLGSTAAAAVGKGRNFVSREPPADAPVGNFGLVCAPMTGRVTRTQTEVDRPLAAMVAIVAGDYDFARTPNGEFFDLNAYLNEAGYVGLGVNAFQQTLQLCPPGRYLSGLRVRTDGSFIQGVDALWCTNLHGDTLWQLHEPLGTGAGQSEDLICRNVIPKSVVGGIGARSGWLLDAVTLNCAAVLPQ